MEVLINVKNKKVLTPLLNFLKAIGVEVIENKKTLSKTKTNVSALKKLSENGGIKNIENPMAWQKETRKDRELPR